jgi:hypothetical protein
MASFYRASVAEFLSYSEGELLARLSVGYANRGFTTQYSDQTLTWERDLRSLRDCLRQCLESCPQAAQWGVILEFSIPRKERRIDVVLLIKDSVVLLEAKTGEIGSAARQQLEEYALLLYYFHKASAQRRIISVAITQTAPKPHLLRLDQREFFPQMATYWICPVITSAWRYLAEILLDVDRHGGAQSAASDFDESPYFPVPSIIEAATALSTGLSIREIAHSEASEHEVKEVCATIQEYVNLARTEKHHAICFLTGVPGSGKTLVGLSLAHSDENKHDAIHFMSGNGPLVQVLQHLFTQEAMRRGTRALEARQHARTLIENVHVFARYHTEDNLGAASNHAIIFDEAQRAWNRTQNMKKFKRDYSEPEMLLKIMERHEDWSMVIALVGGGQEINDGEAGLEEWGRALRGAEKKWFVYASPEVLEGGPSTAGHKLFEEALAEQPISTNLHLHLRTSNRSLRAENLAKWVNCVITGDASGAAAIKISDRFPLFLSRSLEETRAILHQQQLGASRHGLVGSSGAARLRAEGLEPSSSFHAEYPWEHWYLAGASDIRSSFRCEVFATEFEIQGLELDWIGLCWGGDMIWSPSGGWKLRTLRHGTPTKWSEIKNPEKRIYRQNAYRVLLTRARQGMVIFVPPGSAEDQTNAAIDFDLTAQFLLDCGVLPLSETIKSATVDDPLTSSLFA